MYCESCGSLIPDGHSFCSNCGTPVAGPQVQPAQAAAPAPAPAPAPVSAPAPVAAPVPSTVSAPAPVVNRPAQAPVVNTEVKPKREKFFSSINITFGIGVLQRGL